MHGSIAIIVSVLAVLELAGCNAQHTLFWKSNDESIHVIDNAFGASNKLTKGVLKDLKERTWGFTVDNTNPDVKHTRMGFKTKSSKRLKQLKAMKKLHSLAQELYGNSSRNVIGLQGRIIERGDFDPVIEECDSPSSKVRAVVILTLKWRKNDYGEVTVYDKKGEILKSIHPRFGRAVFIPCDRQFKISPPSINVQERHYILLAEFGDSQGKFPEEKPEWSVTKFFEKHVNIDSSPYQNMNISEFVTRKYFTDDGKKIFVYDNAIPLVILDTLTRFIVNHADYHESPVFEEGSADNVKWIIGLDDPNFQDTTLWLIVKQLVAHIAGKEFYPYDLSCNHIRRTDTTHNHKDTYANEDIYTVVIYLNANWTENSYGETSFLQNREIVAAVRPKYGRVAIFHGKIDHSAHPSSPEYPGARYTFAIKTAPSIKVAMSKIFAEDGVKYSKVQKMLTKMKAEGGKDQKVMAENFLDKLDKGRISSSDISFLKEKLGQKMD